MSGLIRAKSHHCIHPCNTYSTICCTWNNRFLLSRFTWQQYHLLSTLVWITSVFSNDVIIRFLKGLNRLYPQLRWLIPPWDLILVLPKLKGSFEPLAVCSLLQLSWKVVFLIIIPCVSKVSEWYALISKPRYTVFKVKVYLYRHLGFLSKIVSNFHNQSISLSTTSHSHIGTSNSCTHWMLDKH